MSNLDFGDALERLKAGDRVTRAGWNGKGTWIALSPGFTLTPERVFSEPVAAAIDASVTGVGTFRPYLMMRTVDDEYVPWVASQTDILADDWEIAR